MESKHKCIIVCCGIICAAILAGYAVYVVQEKQKAAFRAGYIHISDVRDNWVRK